VGTADAVAVALRALGFFAAVQAAGAALFSSIFAERLDRSMSAIAKSTVFTAGAALLLTVAAQVTAPARLVGSLEGIFDGPLQVLMLASDAGAATAVRVLGLVLVVLGTGREDRLRGTAVLFGAVLVVVSFAFMGHTAADEHRWLAAVLLIWHLAVVALWFGALQPLRIGCRDEDMATSGALLTRFSGLAGRLVPTVFLAGAGLAILLLPGWDALTTPYGRLLLTKVAVFSMLLGLAALNKWRYGPRVTRGDTAALGTLRRIVLLEWWLVATVLVVTAVMTALFSPSP
jgi:putative copper export protein